MTSEQKKALLSIAFLAALADGAKDEQESERLRQLADSLDEDAKTPDLPGIYRNVLLKRVMLASATVVLEDHEHRQLAYEMAVCVCDADGQQTAAERQFLDELQGLLDLDAAQALDFSRQAEAIVETVAIPLASGDPTIAPTAASGPVVAIVPNVSEGELDQLIVNRAIINGALELLPQSWASLAIIPLQIKLVYKIGQAHGVELDQGHIKEFIATLGVGLTSQYLEQFGRKLLGGVLGKVGGKLGQSIGQTATGMAFSFATTYAIGQVARRYYAGGRQMDSGLLRQSFAELLAPAKELQSRYLPQIEQTASGLDASKVMALLRGQ